MHATAAAQLLQRYCSAAAARGLLCHLAMKLRSRWLIPVLALLFALLAACSADDGQTPGVDSGVTIDATSSADAAPGAKKAFGEACANGPECASGLCFNFNSQGQHCTKPCMAATAPADCAPSTFGCSNMMICKIR
jgi:hypothetical protein